MELDIEKLLKRGVIIRMDIDRAEIDELLASSKSLLAEADQLLSTDPLKSFVRAYDAVFSSCCAFMLSLGYRLANGPDHRSVLEFCGLMAGEACADILHRFQAAEIRRHHEMYEGHYSIDKTEVVTLLGRARLLIQRIKPAI